MSRGDTVLLVEDDASLAQVLAFALQAEGFEAYSAGDGLQGFASYSHHPTDWVVTDIQMPGLDGIAMMECIRTIKPHVRVIYMTASVEEYRGALTREKQYFAAKVLSKPFSRAKLIQQLSESVSIQNPRVPECHYSPASK